MVGISAVAVHFVHHFRDNFVYRASFFRDFDLFDFVLLMFLCFNNNRLIVDLVFFCTKSCTNDLMASSNWVLFKIYSVPIIKVFLFFLIT